MQMSDILGEDLPNLVFTPYNASNRVSVNACHIGNKLVMRMVRFQTGIGGDPKAYYAEAANWCNEANNDGTRLSPQKVGTVITHFMEQLAIRRLPIGLGLFVVGDTTGIPNLVNVSERFPYVKTREDLHRERMTALAFPWHIIRFDGGSNE